MSFKDEYDEVKDLLTNKVIGWMKKRPEKKRGRR
jgi:hypothetical protein